MDSYTKQRRHGSYHHTFGIHLAAMSNMFFATKRERAYFFLKHGIWFCSGDEGSLGITVGRRGMILWEAFASSHYRDCRGFFASFLLLRAIVA